MTHRPASPAREEGISKDAIHLGGEEFLFVLLDIDKSEYPVDTGSFWQAIKFADVSLYNAKESGRNKAVRFTTDMWSEKYF